LYEKFRQAAIENYSHIQEILHLKDSQALVSKALDTLPPQQRKVFERCRIEGYSYKEVAEILGIPAATSVDYGGNPAGFCCSGMASTEFL